MSKKNAIYQLCHSRINMIKVLMSTYAEANRFRWDTKIELFYDIFYFLLMPMHSSYSSYDKYRNRCYTMQIKSNSVLPSEMLHEFRKSSNMGPERQTNVLMCDELRQFGEKSTIHGLENILGKSSHCYRKYVR